MYESYYLWISYVFIKNEVLIEAPKMSNKALKKIVTRYTLSMIQVLPSKVFI